MRMVFILFERDILMLMHRLDFPVIQNLVMKEPRLFSEVGDAVLERGVLCDLSGFMIEGANLFGSPDDGTDVRHPLVVEAAPIGEDLHLPFDLLVRLLDQGSVVGTGGSFGL